MRVRPESKDISLEAMEATLLKEVEQLAREKGLDREGVFLSLEQAFQRVMKEIYGHANDIRVTIRRSDGHLTITRHLKVVEEVSDPAIEIAHVQVPHLAIGDEKIEILPLPPLNRVVVQTIKKSLTRSIQDLEQEIQYNEFKDRVGQIVSGIVKRIEGGNLIIDIGKAEGIILRNEVIPREGYRLNDRIKAYIYAVRRESRGPQIFLSRTHPGFLAKLFAQEVPEIYDGLIEIKAVARDPGSRAKVAILSKEERSFDAIGACVGVRGSRVNAVSQELQGERIDIIQWSSDLPVFVVNALTPAEVTKVILENKKDITVVVPDQQQSIAIGRKGQNVRLAHQLTGVNIEITTETVEAQQRSQLRKERAASFMEKLDLDEMMAHFLVSEGFETAQEIAEAPISELAALEGFTEEVAQELKERAKEAAREEELEACQAFLHEGGDQRIIDLGIPPRALRCLREHKILSLKDFADLSLEELLDIVKSQHDLLGEEEWGQLILKARNL